MYNFYRPFGMTILGIVFAIAIVVLTSCASVGPNTIPRDQFDYGDAISNSLKEQLLTNIIRLRYVEAPVFVNVSSVINQYALEGEVALGAGLNTAITGENTANIGGTGRFSDRPTITYTPVSGHQFSISLLTPVSPEAIFALVQAGWAPEVIMRMALRSMNGVRNAVANPLDRQQAQPEFIKILQNWRRLRQARSLGLRKDEGKIKDKSRIVVYQALDEFNPEVAQDLAFLLDSLELDPDAREYPLTYGLIPNKPNEIAVLTVSMLELMNELAWRADVPPEHIDEGRTGPTFVEGHEMVPLVRIHYARERPKDSYVSIRSRDYWFYIDDRDVASKRTFAIMQILLSLAESGEAARGPVVTIGG
jgi:hypothetical protein